MSLQATKRPHASSSSSGLAEAASDESLIAASSGLAEAATDESLSAASSGLAEATTESASRSCTEEDLSKDLVVLQLSDKDALMLLEKAIGQRPQPLGQGATYVAYELCDERFLQGRSKVVLRCPQSFQNTMPDADEAFFNEVSNMKAMNGCWAAPILHAFNLAHKMIVMEYFEGGSLAERLRSPGVWDEQWWLWISCSRQILEASAEFLSYLGKGRVLVHGDIKVNEPNSPLSWSIIA